MRVETKTKATAPVGVRISAALPVIFRGLRGTAPEKAGNRETDESGG